MIDFRELVRLGAHFGHIKRRLHPKMNCYIWGCKNNVHLFDVSITAKKIEDAAKVLESIAGQNKTVLWVGTKKPARDAIFEVSQKLKMPYVNHRWIGGTLSNFSQVKKSVTKLLHYEDILEKAERFPHYTKKELNSFSKMVDRLKKNIGGIRNLAWPIGAVVLVDALKEGAALREAVTVGIPVISLVDTNTDPSLVDHVIPVNDDSARVIKLVLNYLADSVVAGQKKSKTVEKKKKEEKEVAKPKLKAEGTKKKEAVAPSKKQEAPKKVAVAKKTTIVEKKPVAVPVAAKKASPEKKKEVATKKVVKSSSAKATADAGKVEKDSVKAKADSVKAEKASATTKAKADSAKVEKADNKKK